MEGGKDGEGKGRMEGRREESMEEGVRGRESEGGS